MKTKLTFWSSMLFLLSVSILLTIYLAWVFYPMEIQWLNLTFQQNAVFCQVLVH